MEHDYKKMAKSVAFKACMMAQDAMDQYRKLDFKSEEGIRTAVVLIHIFKNIVDVNQELIECDELFDSADIHINKHRAWLKKVARAGGIEEILKGTSNEN